MTIARGMMISVFLVCVACARAGADDASMEPLALLQARCGKCHGETKPKGGIQLPRDLSAGSAEARAGNLQRVLLAIESNDMPPEGQRQFSAMERDAMARWLKESMRAATPGATQPAARLHRLTRPQYNHAVRDLFRLNRDVFELPEKLMTRLDRHVPSATGRMPERVQVASRALNPEPGLAGVKPFPKDLRAEHGFDNQANKLTLSPLLLDSFLRLGISIIESPDFNANTVGIWQEFFQEPPANADRPAEIARRLRRFLRLAFRRPVDEEVLRRYAGYAESKMRQGSSFTEGMKKVASAALSSPMFLYRSTSADGSDRQFELASSLSFLLWSSIPDAALLDMAERGEFSDPAKVRLAVDRMVKDPKIERFLDSFPTQWLQLENVLGATPDKGKSPYFNIDEGHPASLAMLVEPLLLFDAAFVENLPVTDLISPSFSYRSEFLRDWYGPKKIGPVIPSAAEVAERNRLNDSRRTELRAMVADLRAAIDAIVEPVRARSLAERGVAVAGATDKLKPFAQWDFNGDLKDSIRGLDLKSFGEVRHQDGGVVLGKGYLQSGPLPVELKAKTLEVWCELSDINQRGGGIMTIEGPAGLFDSIVLGERKPGHWISGSNNFARTEDFAGSEPESKPSQMLHLVMVYEADGTTRLYRNGVPYGKPFRKGIASFPKDKSFVLFGLRHLPAGGNKHLSARLNKARLYDRALSSAEVAVSAAEGGFQLSDEVLARFLSKADLSRLRDLRTRLDMALGELEKVPLSVDFNMVRKDATREFEDQLRAKLRSPVFQRVPLASSRDGGVITNAAVLSMTSGPLRTQPIARGAWILEVIFNDPPPPPPNDVPPLKENSNPNLTIREQFAAHRENASCAGCHSKIDPLGFALENFDITGRWREKYENGRPIDASGTLWRRYSFTAVDDFKAAIVKEKERFAKAFSRHLLRYALAREMTPADAFTVDEIIERTRSNGHRLQEIIREVAFHAALGTPAARDERPPK